MRWWTVLVVVLVAACGPLEAPPTPVPPPVVPTPTAAPASPDEVATRYFAAWHAGQFEAMHGLLSSTAQAATPRDAFVRRYSNIRSGIGEARVVAQPTGPARSTSDTGAEVPFQITRSLDIFGEISETAVLPLVLEHGEYRVAWQPSLIFGGLTAANSVRVLPEAPRRGRLLDRSGTPLADNGSIVAIGVVPGQITDEPALLQGLSRALEEPEAAIKSRYQNGQPTWFMPVATRPSSERAALEDAIGKLAGVSLQDRPARVYPLGAAAAHVVGYVSHPTAAELRQLAQRGYDESDWVGRAGLEAWAEDQLAGTPGGVIQIVDQTGRVLRTVAHKPAVPGVDVTLTLDAAIQAQAFEALGDRVGSAVVMDPRDNALLALVSRPSFDPNRFIVGMSDAEWQALNGDDRPLMLRATEAAYPTGSIFKVITMAAGLEQGGFTPASMFDCGLNWNGLPGVTLHNWEAQGRLNLTQALTASCNPAFYEIGLALDTQDPELLPSYARRFGLGRPTGLVGLPEVAGNVPDPTSTRRLTGQGWASGDAVNLAIGQGALLATPIQMANAYAALARGGPLLTPVLTRAADNPVRSTLGLSQPTLAAILEGMQRVTSTSLGTATSAFRGERLAIAAKTGSAENEHADAHAWFVGYLPPGSPTLLVLVMIERGEHGGTVASPVARQVIDFAAARGAD